MYIEDKLKEMDDKLSDLFSISHSKHAESNSPERNNTFARDIIFNSNRYDKHSAQVENKPPAENDKRNKEYDIRHKKEELYNKLNDTEKKIKSIAGRILKNF